MPRKKVKNRKHIKIIPLTFVFFVSISLLSCNASLFDDGQNDKLVDVTLALSTEKYLTHDYVDGVVKHTYTATCLSHSGAVGETKEEKLLVLDKDNLGAIGSLEPGLWLFNVYAYNSKDLLVYSGEGKANISYDNNTASVVLVLNKEGEGTVRVNVTSKSTGLKTTLVATYSSYDEKEKGEYSAFTLTSDGITDTWTGSFKLNENRYRITFSITTDTSTLSSDITDALVLKDSIIDVRGVIDGKENPNVTLKPVEREKPVGKIKLSQSPIANYKNTLLWETEYKDATVVWYIDGKEVGTGLEKEVTLPGPGLHNISATATLDGESYSDTYILDLCSSPLYTIDGTVIYDRGEQYGLYWFDELGTLYRRLDGITDKFRYLVYDPFEENTNTYSYDEAIEVGKNLASYKKEGYRIPTLADAKKIQEAAKKGIIKVPSKFWTQTEYENSNSYAYLAKDTTSIDVVGKGTKASVVLVKDI